MRGYSLGGFLLLWVSLGQPKPGPYHRDKWMIGESGTARPLLGRPRFVKEDSYAARDTPSRSSHLAFSMHYVFDTAGNVISQDTYMDETLVSKLESRIDENGYQVRFVDKMTKRSYKTTSRRLPDGRYKSVLEVPGDTPVTWLVSFLGRDEVINEMYRDTFALVKPIQITHSFFKANRVSKVIYQTPSSSIESRYFYSTFDQPDSVLSFNGTGPTSTLYRRQLLFRNRQGDVETQLDMAGGDTTHLQRNEYKYDDKGNWIRRVSTKTVDKNDRHGGDKTVITDREFVYW